MKLGIMADSHENMPAITRAVELFNREEVNLVLHAGDIISPITAKEFGRLEAKMVLVLGNNDGERFFLKEKFEGIGDIHERRWEGNLGGMRVLLMHQPDMLEALVKSGCYDLIIYGHTHRIDVRRNGTLVVNPGECGGWITGRSTVAVLDTETMGVEVREL